MAQLAGAAEYTDRSDSSNECSGYDTKQFDGEASVMLKLWGMQSVTSLSSLWLGVVAPDRVLSMGQIDLFDI